jgi:acyl-CoA thioester hydrolase
VKIRVYYEDTDAGGIVYHTNYIKYCERARSELFFSQGIMPLEGGTSGFIVSGLKADFHASAKLGDMLEVKSHMLSRKRSSLLLMQEIYKEDQKIFTMEIKLAYIAEGKISRMPQHFLELFENML